MIYLAVLIFIAYNFVVFEYSGHIYEKNIKYKSIYVLIIMINSVIFILPIYITMFEYEYIIMIIYFIFIGVEMAVLFRQSVNKIILGVMAFATNFFAIRVIIVGVLAVLFDIPIYKLVQDENIRIFITLVNFTVPIPYILMTRKILPSNVFELLLNSESNLLFSVVVLSVTYLNQMVNAIFLLNENFELQNENIIAHSQIRTGLFTIAIFLTLMASVYIFSNLRLKAIQYNTISKEIEKQEIIVEKIVAESNIDTLTKLYTRNVAINRIKEYAKNQDNFFVLFIDMDGLKTANDNYGHEEGDYYIRKVTQYIKEIFEGDLKARIGGDEFLVVGKFTDENKILENKMRCEENIGNIGKTYNKKYQTSISSGILFVKDKTEYTAEELIQLADEKMYAVKKERKKEREIIKVMK